MIIAISGTPGTGKTYIAKKLSKASKSRLEYFDLNKYIKDNRLYDSYDRKAKTFDVDIDVLKHIINPTLKYHKSRDKFMDSIVGKTISIDILIKKIPKSANGIIVDSHLSHYLDNDYCIIVKTDLKKLYNRLKKRDYSKKKIQENIESEIFGICLEEAKKFKDKVIIIEN